MNKENKSIDIGFKNTFYLCEAFQDCVKLVKSYNMNTVKFNKGFREYKLEYFSDGSDIRRGFMLTQGHLYPFISNKMSIVYKEIGGVFYFRIIDDSTYCSDATVISFDSKNNIITINKADHKTKEVTLSLQFDAKNNIVEMDEDSKLYLEIYNMIMDFTNTIYRIFKDSRNEYNTEKDSNFKNTIDLLNKIK